MKKLTESDIKAIKAWNQFKASAAGENSTMTDEIDWDCEYVEYSTVPDQTGGAFWSILNRIFIGMSPRLIDPYHRPESYWIKLITVFECLLLTLSEMGVPKRLFEEFLPILGPAHGLGCLGVFQALYVLSLPNKAQAYGVGSALKSYPTTANYSPK